MGPVARVFTEGEVADFKRIGKGGIILLPVFQIPCVSRDKFPRGVFIAEKLVLKHHRCRAQARGYFGDGGYKFQPFISKQAKRADW
jgi:hypothetical protein